jgi:hypothetical protein
LPPECASLIIAQRYKNPEILDNLILGQPSKTMQLLL